MSSCKCISRSTTTSKSTRVVHRKMDHLETELDSAAPANAPPQQKIAVFPAAQPKGRTLFIHRVPDDAEV